MRSLDLDYLRESRPGGWARWTLLVVAIAFAGDLGVSWYRAREGVEEKEARLASLGARLTAPAAADTRALLDPEDLRFARDTARRLSLPWPQLFAALEQAQNPAVTLLAIEPDVEAGTVLVTAEARDYFAAVSYVATLEGAKTLARVHLVRHEVRANDPRRAVSFTVSARWRTPA